MSVEGIQDLNWKTLKILSQIKEDYPSTDITSLDWIFRKTSEPFVGEEGDLCKAALDELVLKLEEGVTTLVSQHYLRELKYWKVNNLTGILEILLLRL